MVTVFAEGGGKRDSKTLFQRQLSRLIAKAAPGVPVRVVACGARGEALRRFARGLSGGRIRPMLLVDSERPVREGNWNKPWTHLAEPPDNWQKPPSAGDDSAHLMAQCMESWFVADPDALAAHFGQGFNPAKLPRNPKVEEIAKLDVMSGLDAATRETGKGAYRKTRDGFVLIGKIDPLRVADCAPHAKRFFDILRRKPGAQPAS